MTSRLALALAVLVVPIARGATQLPTIPERLATEGSSKRVTGVFSGASPSVDDLLKETDLVLRATVGAPTTFLSEDKRDVYSDYPLRDVQILYQRKLERPGVLPPLIVTVKGGTITIDGRTFEQVEEAFPALAPGTKGVFLLKRKGDRYRLAGSVLGAFGITEAGLRPFTPKSDFARELSALPVSVAEARLAARAQALHP